MKIFMFVLVLCATFALAHEGGGNVQRFTFSEPHLGTLFKIICYAPDEATASKASKAAFARIAELDQIMSDYKPSSELMQLCKKAGGDPVQVSIDLYTILERAQEVARKTDGAFDVTVGPVVRLWRKARRLGQLPSKEELKEALRLVGYEKIKLDPTKRAVQLLVAGMLLDLGGIAKGYAADAALEILKKHGIKSALIAAGGDIAVSDPPPDAKGWKIGIAPLKDPEGEPAQFLLLSNAAVSTAGDTHQYVEIGGKRYSHIVDPKTGIGLTVRRSVTVVAREGVTADAWDTALSVMDPGQALKTIKDVPGAEVQYTWETPKGSQVIQSPGFVKYLIITKKETLP